MAKKASASKKKKNNKIRRTVLGTLSGVFMASALIIAAIPVQKQKAANSVTPDGLDTWTTAYDAHPETVIPDYTAASKYYNSTGLFGVAVVQRAGSAETAGVLCYYDSQNAAAASDLVIPDEVECFLYNDLNKLQAVNSSNTKLYYISQEEVVSENSVVLSPAVYSPCLADNYGDWSGQNLYTSDDGSGAVTEQLKVNVRYIGSDRYEAGPMASNYALQPATGNNVGKGVFEGAKNFSSVSIPGHILAIGNKAFQECQMESVSIADKVLTIGNHAFDSCNRLKNVSLANNTDLSDIGSYCFANCVYLESISIPDQVEQIGSGCFMNCEMLAAANLYGSDQNGNANLKFLGDGVFYGCTSLLQLALPNNLQNMSTMKYLCYGCSHLQNLTLSKHDGDFTYTNVTGCSSLVYLVIPNSNTKLDCTFDQTPSTKNGYKHASLSKTANINSNPSGCTFGALNIGSFSAFGDFEVPDEFTIVTYRNSNAYIYACEHEFSVGYLDEKYQGQFERVKNNYFFSVDDTGNLTHFGLYDESGDSSVVVIPEAIGKLHITSIDADTFTTFSDKENIKYVYIPSTVATIEPGSFVGCINLEAVEFGDARAIENIGSGAFKTGSTDESIKLHFIGTISTDSEPFLYAMSPENNYNDSSISTKYISYTSSFPTNLQVELEVEKDPVTGDVKEAVPTLVSAPHYSDFCSPNYSLMDSIYPSKATDENKLVMSAYNKYTYGGTVSEDEQAVIDAVFKAILPPGIERIRSDVYQGDEYISSAVMNTVYDIPAESFKGCKKLETVIMRSSGKSEGEKVGDHAFDDCTQLSTVVLPHTLSELGDLPFCNDDMLLDVDFGENGNFNCENAIIYETLDDGTKSIIQCLPARGNTIGTGKIRESEFDNVTNIRKAAFKDCKYVTQVYFGQAKIPTIPDECFENCEKLNYCEVSDFTNSIGEHAFHNTALSDIRIPANVVMIAENAFTTDNPDGTESIIKGLNFQCEVPSTAYTYALRYGIGTDDRILHKYTVVFFDNDSKEINRQLVEEGSDAVAPDAPAVEGREFVEWKPDFHDVSSDLNVYPIYKIKEKDVSDDDNLPVYTVTFYNFDGSMKINVQKVKEGKSAVAPETIPEREGYTFTGWLPEFKNVISDLDVYPQYKKGTTSTEDPNKKPSDQNTDPKKEETTPGTTNPGTTTPGTTNPGTTNPGTTGTTPGTTNPGSGTTTNPGGATNKNPSNGGTVSKNNGVGNYKTTPNGTTVVVDKSGINNKSLVSANVNGSTDDFVLKITDSEEARSAVEQALLKEYGNLDDIRYFAMDISLYDKTGTSKIQNLNGVSVTVTMPIPEGLASYGGNNKAGAVINGDTLEKLDARFTTIDGVPCISFVASHFSPYTVYVDLNNLQASLNGSDMTPTTGDPIHPKWFLSIGLALMSILLFFMKGSKKKVVKVIS